MMVKLIKVYSTIDESVVLSLLDSADIETITDATNFNRVQFGTLFTEDTGVTISVNEEDLPEAKEIAHDFFLNRTREAGASTSFLPKLL